MAMIATEAVLLLLKVDSTYQLAVGDEPLPGGATLLATMARDESGLQVISCRPSPTGQLERFTARSGTEGIDALDDVQRESERDERVIKRVADHFAAGLNPSWAIPVSGG